jgi:hypothetical protein
MYVMYISLEKQAIDNTSNLWESSDNDPTPASAIAEW